MDDERDAEYAIRALDRTEFGRNGRRLRVEWTKQEQGGRKPAVSRKSANLKPSKTLFVINFPYDTKERDIERHFDPYGKIINVRIRKNFAFVQYESLDDAINALDATNMSKMSDRVISVEYSARGDDDRRNGNSPDGRGRDRSPDRRRRSPGPLRRERGSPDYGAGSRKERGSPEYGHGSRKERGSPEYGHGSRKERGSPEYGHGTSRSPRRVERGSPSYDHRKKSPSARRDALSSPNNGHGRSRSPPRRVERGSPDYDHRKNSPNPRHDEKTSPDIGRGSSRSSRRVERGSPDYDHRKSSPSPYPHRGERNRNGDNRNPSPHHIEEASPGPEHGLEPRSPNNKPDLRRDSPTRAGEYGSPLDDSRSPVARQRSQS